LRRWNLKIKLKDFEELFKNKGSDEIRELLVAFGFSLDKNDFIKYKATKHKSRSNRYSTQNSRTRRYSIHILMENPFCEYNDRGKVYSQEFSLEVEENMNSEEKFLSACEEGERYVSLEGLLEKYKYVERFYKYLSPIIKDENVISVSSIRGASLKEKMEAKEFLESILKRKMPDDYKYTFNSYYEIRAEKKGIFISYTPLLRSRTIVSYLKNKDHKKELEMNNIISNFSIERFYDKLLMLDEEYNKMTSNFEKLGNYSKVQIKMITTESDEVEVNIVMNSNTVKELNNKF